MIVSIINRACNIGEIAIFNDVKWAKNFFNPNAVITNGNVNAA